MQEVRVTIYRNDGWKHTMSVRDPERGVEELSEFVAWLLRCGWGPIPVAGMKVERVK